MIAVPGTHVQNLIVGQGLAGSAVAWHLHWQGEFVQILDDERAVTASRVSAGLITPFTGKRMVQAPDFSADWSAATEFYSRVEQATGASFFSIEPMYRLKVVHRENFPTAKIRLTEGAKQKTAVRMESAARLDVQTYLEATRRYFAARGAYQMAQIDFEKLQLGKIIQLSEPELIADRLVLATGAATQSVFPEVPNNPSRGDILEVEIADYLPTKVVHAGIWVAPRGDQQLVGSTYDWDFLKCEPTDTGQTEIMDRLNVLVGTDVRVLKHRAAVRPTMKDYQPAIGRHAEHAGVWMINGLGSKGSLKAPRAAAELVAEMQGKQEIAAHRRISRIQPPTRQRPLTQRAQEVVAEVIQPGDHAVDATVGNGFDTCFLAELVGPTGSVLGFDLQQQAVDATAKRLRASGLRNVRLLQQGHETLADESSEGLAAVMFNLGYLPRADKTVITRAETTLPAVESAMRQIRPGGVVTILCYRGHEGGPEEFAAVENLLSEQKVGYDLERINSRPNKPTAPVLLVIRKQTLSDGIP